MLSRLLTLEDHIVIGTKQIHPLATKINLETEQLCRQLGIYYDRFHERNTMLAYVLPGGNPAHLVTLNLYTNLLWYIDDMYDRNDLDMQSQRYELKQVYQTCSEIIFTGKLPKNRHILHNVCCELYERFHAQSPYSSWLTAFMQHTATHLQFSTTDSEDIIVNGKLSIDRYIQLREQDSGMYPTIYYIPFAYELALSPTELDALHYINRLTVQIGALSNDIFSYEKEVLRLKSEFNLIAVIEAAYNLKPEEAISEAIMIVNEKSQAFEAEYARFLAQPDLDPAVKIYIDGLRDLCAATYHWQMSTNRYRSPQSPHPVLRQMLPADDFFTGNPSTF